MWVVQIGSKPPWALANRHVPRVVLALEQQLQWQEHRLWNLVIANPLPACTLVWLQVLRSSFLQGDTQTLCCIKYPHTMHLGLLPHDTVHSCCLGKQVK